MGSSRADTLLQKGMVMTDLHAIISFDSRGPAKSWSAVQAIQAHNSREEKLDHVEAGAPAPLHVIGSGDLAGDMRARLVAHGVRPERLRTNGVLCYEAVLTASRQFFEGGDFAVHRTRLGAWVKAQRDFVLAKYGAHRVVSLVLHVDELTPHMHLVVLPLERKVDGRRGDGLERWSLVGRSIAGPGEFDRLQTEYAAAMSGFGLRRGEAGAGRKNQPVREYLKRIAELEEEAVRARKRAEAVVAEYQARLADLGARQATAREQSLRAAAELNEARRCRRAAADELGAVRRERELIELDGELLDRKIDAVERTVARAGALLGALKGASIADLPPAAQSVYRAIMGLEGEGRAAIGSEYIPAATQAAFQKLTAAALAR